jgi:protein-disulfide isomerase
MRAARAAILKRSEPMRIDRKAAVLAASIVLTLAAYTTAVTSPASAQRLPPGAEPQNEFERWYVVQPRVRVPVDPAGAAVLIVKFSDYQCPPCAQNHANDKPILARYERLYPGAVKLVIMDFPLASGCNPLVKQSVHAAACEAAVAVRLARRQNRGAQMQEWLFANQPALTPALVRDAARSIGGITDFGQAYEPALADVKADVGVGQALGVTQTPTVFINGVRFDGGLAPQFSDMAIACELRRSGRAASPVKR